MSQCRILRSLPALPPNEALPSSSSGLSLVQVHQGEESAMLHMSLRWQQQPQYRRQAMVPLSARRSDCSTTTCAGYVSAHAIVSAALPLMLDEICEQVRRSGLGLLRRLHGQRSGRQRLASLLTARWMRQDASAKPLTLLPDLRRASSRCGCQFRSPSAVYDHGTRARRSTSLQIRCYDAASAQVCIAASCFASAILPTTT